MKRNGSLESIALIVRENPGAVAAVCACLFFSSFLEALGISAILPLIAGIMETQAPLPPSDLTRFMNQLALLGPYKLSALVCACFVAKSVILGFAMRIVGTCVADFSHSLRVNFIRALTGARIPYVLSRSLGENLAILSDGSVRAGAAYISAARVLAGFIQVLLYVMYALWLSVPATLLSAVTMGVLALMIKKTMDRTRKAGAETTQHIYDISRNMGETLRAMKEARATARETYFEKFLQANSEVLRRAHVVNIVVGQTLRNIQDPVTITSALICLLLFKEVLHLEPGYILFILAIYYRLMSSANTMLADYQKFIGQESALQTIRAAIDAAKAEQENLPAGIAPPREPQTIAFDRVRAAYGDKTIFSDVSFTVPARTFTVFRGESGRGKTTAIDMLCRLLEPASGSIRIGDTPLSAIDPQQWRQRLGYVDQFPFLLKGTIRENILFDLQDVPEDGLRRCLELCKLDAFVDSLPGGLDYTLNEGGTNISGGQRQRIAIARSVIRNPAYLILDEPTSALDADSTEAILSTLAHLSAAMTVIMVSHSAAAEKRAQTVIDFDKF